MSETGHSAAVLTELRDSWWSDDYLSLVVSRLKIKDSLAVADVGCGHGHWGQRLLPLLNPDAKLLGIDQEQKWVDKAVLRADALGIAGRCDYQVASAERLPWADASFDLVTCQTLLMHLADPLLALAEMLRVVKPGGLLLLAEPNNVAQQFAADSVNRELSASELGRLMSLFTACSRGRAKLGRGDDCIGDRLPSLLMQLEVEQLSVFQNEKTGVILPPYDAADQSELQQSISHSERGFWLWDQADAKRLYLAGGGAQDDFESDYEVFTKRTMLFKQQVNEQRYWCNNGSLHYLVAARRPH